MQKWKVDTKDVRFLLGGITSRRFRQLSTRPKGRILNQDQLLRATNVIAIDQSLHKLLPRRQADKWVQTPNRQFCGGTPLCNMVGGGALTLWEWRQPVAVGSVLFGDAGSGWDFRVGTDDRRRCWHRRRRSKAIPTKGRPVAYLRSSTIPK